MLAVSGSARWKGMVFAGYSEEERRSGRSGEEITARENALFDAVITGEEYPQLRAAIDAGVFLSESDPFRFGVERLLDGVEAYLSGRGERGATALVAPHASPDDADVADVADDKRYRQAAKAALDAEKAVLQAEKALRQAQKARRQALAEARERAK